MMNAAIYDARSKGPTSIAVLVADLNGRTCEHENGSDEPCGAKATHWAVRATGIFVQCESHGCLGHGRAEKRVLAIIDADGLHESGKSKIGDMLHHECDYCWNYGLASDIKCDDGRECVCDKCTEEANS